MKTVRHIIAVMGYSIFLRLCYCLLVYGKVLLYGDWKEDLFYHAANVVPMAVMAGCFIMLQVYKKLFKIFSKVLCDIIPACFRRFNRKIALLFSSKNDENLHKSLSQIF